MMRRPGDEGGKGVLVVEGGNNRFQAGNCAEKRWEPKLRDMALGRGEFFKREGKEKRKKGALGGGGTVFSFCRKHESGDCPLSQIAAVEYQKGRLSPGQEGKKRDCSGKIFTPESRNSIKKRKEAVSMSKASC